MNNKTLTNDPKRQNCPSVKAVGKSSGLGVAVTTILQFVTIQGKQLL